MGQEVQADVLEGGQGAGRRWLLLLALHLLPGVALALVFWLLTETLVAAGATAYLALILTIPLCLVPVEMGIVLAWSYKTTGRWSVRSALGYGARWGAGEWLWITLLLLLIVGLMSLVTGPMSVWLEGQLGPWVPVWLTTGDAIGALARVSPAQRWVRCCWP